MFKDIRYSLRVLSRARSFTFATIITLTLGVGATVGMYALLNAVVLRPLTYHDPDNVTLIWETKREQKADRITVAPANYADWKTDNHVFSDMAFIMGGVFDLVRPGSTERLAGMRVSANFFDVLGTSAMLGRSFSAGEDQEGAAAVTILSHAFWQQLGGRADVIGTAITLNGRIYSVIGVMPPDFYFPEFGKKWQLWVPYILDPGSASDRRMHLGAAVARLRDRVSYQQAQAEMDALAARLESSYPATNTGSGVRLIPIGEQVVGGVRQTLLMIFGAVLILLVIACSNIANLFLVRWAKLRNDTAIRIALGARLRDLVRQHLVESLLLAATGAALGVLLAWSLLPVLRSIPADLPRLDTVSIDFRVLSFALLVTALCAVGFGLAPVLQIACGEDAAIVNTGGKGLVGISTRSAKLALRLFVIAEISLAFMLLVAASLMVESLRKVMSLDPGFRSDGVIAVGFSMPRPRYADPRKALAFEHTVLDRVRSLPGVTAAGLTSNLPLGGQSWQINFSIEGYVGTGAEFLAADQRIISPGYFAVMGIPVLSGRPFEETDTANAPLVAVINESLAQKYFPNRDPIGRRVKWGNAEDHDFPWWFMIIGVVADVRHQSLEADRTPEMYMCSYQMDSELAVMLPPDMTLVAQSPSGSDGMAGAIREPFFNLDSSVPILAVRTMNQIRSQSLSSRKLNMVLFVTFGGFALILAWTGVYGVIAYSTALRTKEFTIRLALGAGRWDILRIVLSDAVRLGGIGLAVGLAASWALERLLSSIVYGVSPHSPTLLVAITLVLGSAILLASYIPALRATKVNPAAALRYD